MKRPILPQRFRDDGQQIYRMLDEILVVCPRCESCAQITLLAPGSQDWFAPRRLVCMYCGYVKEWAQKSIRRGWWDKPVTDDFFGLPLWLQEPCEGHILWAYNVRHLNLIEAYVGAKLREHRRRPHLGWANRSLLHRLPRWVSSAKNRSTVLKAIQRLREK